MKKASLLSDINVKKYYLIKKPVRLTDLEYDDLYDDDDNFSWREKARRLQARRWRKIKHQLV